MTSASLYMMSSSEQADSSHNAPGPSRLEESFSFLIFIITGVTIGFEEETVQVPENIRNQTLCLNVLLGHLARTTIISVSYQDQTAISEYTTS